jgi:hypothetical protein
MAAREPNDRWRASIASVRRGILLAAALVATSCGSSKHGTPPNATRPPAPKPSFHVAIAAATHAPRVNVKWWYAVRVSDSSGMGLCARLTMQVIDPLGTAHPVQFGPTTRNIVNWPIRGSYRDYAIWPAASRGYRLTLRATVKAKGATQTASYSVVPR